MTSRAWLFLSIFTVSCGSSHSNPSAPDPATSSASPGTSETADSEETPPPRISELPIREEPALNRELRAEGVTGTIALFDTKTGTLTCSDAKRCRKAHVPVSTFKIPHAIIALETGVVSGPEDVLLWDGVKRQMDAWNRDLTLREAIRVSCVPCFMEIARRVGESRMKAWLSKLDYGNQNASGGERFWMKGGTRITPLETLDFLYRLDTGALPISKKTRNAVVDMILLESIREHVLRGKTGGGAPPDQPEHIAWFVGWIEHGERRIYFASALDGLTGEESDNDKIFRKLQPARQRVPWRVLLRLGLFPVKLVPIGGGVAQ